MDPVESFIKLHRRFSLAALVNTHARLSSLQHAKGSILYEDILQSLTYVMRDMNAQELNAHAALLYEACLCPIVNAKSQMTLQMKPELIENEHGFIKNLLYVMYSRTGGLESPSVEEFKSEAIVFLKSCPPPPPPPQYPSRVVADLAAIGIVQPPLQGRIEFEKSEPIIRLLAQLRKVGMDILFPQSVHDKILACIFVAIKSAATPAHRELIDMVMAVRDSNTITQLESVSKTKVRGVLALLKHGELLVTHGAEGEPVRLQLAYGISTFKDLRERHDNFLTAYMNEHHIYVPSILKCELVWQFEEEVKNQRLEAMGKLMTKLQYFYAGFISNPIKSTLHPEYRDASQFVPPVLSGHQPGGARGGGGHPMHSAHQPPQPPYGRVGGAYEEDYRGVAPGMRNRGAPQGMGYPNSGSSGYPHQQISPSMAANGRYPGAGNQAQYRGSAGSGRGAGGVGGGYFDAYNANPNNNRGLSATAPSFRPNNQFSSGSDLVFGNSNNLTGNHNHQQHQQLHSRSDFDYLGGLGGSANVTQGILGGLGGHEQDWNARFGGHANNLNNNVTSMHPHHQNNLDFSGNELFKMDRGLGQSLRVPSPPTTTSGQNSRGSSPSSGVIGIHNNNSHNSNSSNNLPPGLSNQTQNLSTGHHAANNFFHHDGLFDSEKNYLHRQQQQQQQNVESSLDAIIDYGEDDLIQKTSNIAFTNDEPTVQENLDN